MFVQKGFYNILISVALKRKIYFVRFAELPQLEALIIFPFTYLV